MAMSERIRLIFTVIAVSLVGMVTGLFLGGGLLPSQAAHQQYNERVTTNTEVTNRGHSHDGLSLHEHRITTVVPTTETTPHGYFHDFAAAMAVPGTTPTSATSTPARGTNEVWVINREFQPQAITVPVGTTVTWKSKDFEEHSVTSNTRLFNGYLDPLGSFSYTFTEPGTFNYNCDPHPEMNGKVIVK